MSEQVRRKLKAAMQELDSMRAENGLLKHKLGRLLGAEQEWELVEPGEYARLAAEVERLRAASFVTAVPVEEYERVVKAGEVVASALILFEIMSEEEIQKRLKAWNAAKEGRPNE